MRRRQATRSDFWECNLITSTADDDSDIHWEGLLNADSTRQKTILKPPMASLCNNPIVCGILVFDICRGVSDITVVTIWGAYRIVSLTPWSPFDWWHFCPRAYHVRRTSVTERCQIPLRWAWSYEPGRCNGYVTWRWPCLALGCGFSPRGWYGTSW
jgi:hypothetical protein